MSFINEAFAAGTTGAAHQQASGTSMIVMLVVFVAMIYFLIWRPQSKRAKEQRNLINSVKVGDEIATSGGLFGKVRTATENYFEVEISKGVIVKFQRSAVAYVLPKGTLKGEDAEAEASATA